MYYVNKQFYVLTKLLKFNKQNIRYQVKCFSVQISKQFIPK